MAERQERLSARRQAYHHIRERIIQLDLIPGESINDKEIAEQLEMSRTPVREALILLERIDFIEVWPQRGTFVSQIDQRKVREEQFLRFCVEREMLKRALPKLDHRAKARYLNALADLARADQLVERSARKKILELDNAFHRIAFHMNGEEHLYEHLLSQMQHEQRERILGYLLCRNTDLVTEHQGLFEAIEAQDIDEVDRRLHRHMTHFMDDMEKLRQQHPEFFKN